MAPHIEALNGAWVDTNVTSLQQPHRLGRDGITAGGRTLRKVCCIGAGYVGGPTCAVIANRVPHVTCTVVDLNEKRIEAWNSMQLPIFEPNLSDVIKPAREGIHGEREPNLFFSTDVDNGIRDADMIFISVNTPTKVTGIGAGRALDIGFVEAATRRIARVAETDKIVVEKSTVPCRTAECIRDILEANGKPGVRFDVLSNPEFLAEGTAINDLLHPDRILIGSLSDIDGGNAAAVLVDLYAQWVPRERIITMNLWSSELAKIAANALLAQRISSINALSAICEGTGASIDELSFAVGLDKRIGPYMLNSSVGFGGSCFRKDVMNLVYLADCLHLPQVAGYWKSVIDINEWQKDRFANRVIASLYNTLKNKRIAVFGFAYKKNTGDTRESAAITIVNHLIAEQAQVSIYDPQVKEEEIWHELLVSNDSPEQVRSCVTVCTDTYAACAGAHAVVIVTEWDEFRTSDGNSVTQKLLPAGGASLKAPVEFSEPPRTTQSKLSENQAGKARVDWTRIASVMSKPMFVFDGRNIVDRWKLEQLGFRVDCIGNARSGRYR